MSRVDEIVTATVARIRDGQFSAGQRLPSVRMAARQFGVSKNTMAEAYDRLVALGMVKARQGSGYYVQRHMAINASVVRPHVHMAIDIASLLREQLDHHYDVRPGDGRPPAEWMEHSELKKQFAQFRITSKDWIDFGYGTPWGYGPLRETLQGRLQERSIAVAPDGLMLTSGANHAMDLIVRYYLSPDDTVFVDDPGYYPLFAKLTLTRVRIVGIRRLVDGPDLDDLQEKLSLYRPKLFFTQSHLHNPTGGMLSPTKAFSLLKAAEDAGFVIIENDAFGDLLSPMITRLAALAEPGRVIYIGTFSKTLSANLRLGYLAGDPDLVRKLCQLKMLTTLSGSDYVERFVDRLINSGHYSRHLKRLEQRVDEAAVLSMNALGKLGIKMQNNVKNGFYLWAELPQYCQEAEIARQAAEQSIFIAPGRFFRVDQRETVPAIRVNVAYGNHPKFIGFLAQQLECCQ